MGIEFKTRKISFFYFPAFRDLDEQARFEAPLFHDQCRGTGRVHP